MLINKLTENQKIIFKNRVLNANKIQQRNMYKQLVYDLLYISNIWNYNFTKKVKKELFNIFIDNIKELPYMYINIICDYTNSNKNNNDTLLFILESIIYNFPLSREEILNNNCRILEYLKSNDQAIDINLL